jgi:hypothetical protein
MKFNIEQVRQLEQTMDSLCNAAYALCDNEKMRKVNDLRYLVAEMRLLASNPRNTEAINRFTDLFTN